MAPADIPLASYALRYASLALPPFARNSRQNASCFRVRRRSLSCGAAVTSAFGAGRFAGGVEAAAFFFVATSSVPRNTAEIHHGARPSHDLVARERRRAGLGGGVLPQDGLLGLVQAPGELLARLADLVLGRAPDALASQPAVQLHDEIAPFPGVAFEQREPILPAQLVHHPAQQIGAPH